MFVQVDLYKTKINNLIIKYPDFIDTYIEYNPNYEIGKRICLTKKLYEYLKTKYIDFEDYYNENFKKDDKKKKEYINNYVKKRYNEDEEYKKKCDEIKYKSYNKLKSEKQEKINKIIENVNIFKKSYILAMVYLNRLILQLKNNDIVNKLLEIKYLTIDNEDNIDELFKIKNLHQDIELDDNENWLSYLSYIQEYRMRNIDNCKITKFSYVLINNVNSLIPNDDIKFFEEKGHNIIILSEYPKLPNFQ